MMQNKIKKLIQAMGLTPHMFASNKESFVFQIHTMLFLIDKIDTEDKIQLFKTAEILKNNCFINCNDIFDEEWAKKVTNYALSLIE